MTSIGEALEDVKASGIDDDELEMGLLDLIAVLALTLGLLAASYLVAGAATESVVEQTLARLKNEEGFRAEAVP